MYVGAINATDAGFQRSFDFIIMVVLGGLRSISGAVLAAIILTILPEALRDLAQYRLIIYALLLIIMMILRPQGLFGLKEAWEIRWVKRPAHRISKGPEGRYTMTAPLLNITNIAISFGGLKAVQNFNLQLPRGGLYGLIGPNGAGKTTVFNLPHRRLPPRTPAASPRRHAPRRPQAPPDRRRRALHAPSRTSASSAT